jgi:hypothetical protein
MNKNELYKYELKLERMQKPVWRKLKKESKKNLIGLASWLFLYKGGFRTEQETMETLVHIIAVMSWLFLGFFLARR